VKIKGRNLLIIAAGLATVALLALVGSGRFWTSGPEPAAHIVSETRPSLETQPSPTADDFDRVIIRNIGTVPFEELFDLLRSAPPATRTQWIKQLDELPESPRRTAILSSFYKTFVQLDPQAAAKSIAGLQKKHSQFIALSAMVGAVPQSAIGEMARMLVKLPYDVFPRRSPDYLGNVIYDWSAVDPGAAARFLEENPEASENHAGSLLSNWARLEPEEARAWLERQPESVQTETAFDGLIMAWFQRDETKASAFAVAHGGEEKFKQAINDIAFVLMLRSPDEARTFLLRLPNEARSIAIQAIGMFTTAEKFDASIGSMRPAEDIARWIITLPKESWRKGLGTVLDHWESQNAAGFSAWLQQLPPETRDEIVTTYCFSGVSKELDRALPLLLAMTDPTRRDQTLREYLAGRLPPSHDKAVWAINQSALSQAQKKYVTNLLEPEL
jgi:hypothetical protein